MKTKVQVKDLRVGDLLSSGTKILSGPTSVQDNPLWGCGKMLVGIEYPNKKVTTQYWGKHTTVTVINRNPVTA